MQLLIALLLWAADPAQPVFDADRAFDQATAARGLDGWMSFFAEDAIVNSPRGPVRGKAALREYYSGMFKLKNFSLRWQPFHGEMSKDATMGYTLGTSQRSFVDEKGEMQKKEGHYLTVWRKQPDGSWKVVSDIGN